MRRPPRSPQSRSSAASDVYKRQGYYDIIRRLQPEACISICGPDVRWIGNEAGVSREEEWSVVPRVIMTTERNPGYWRQIDKVPNSTWMDIGSREFIQQYDELIWYPACLLYTSDAADDLLCVEFGGRRINKKKKRQKKKKEEEIYKNK